MNKTNIATFFSKSPYYRTHMQQQKYTWKLKQIFFNMKCKHANMNIIEIFWTLHDMKSIERLHGSVAKQLEST